MALVMLVFPCPMRLVFVPTLCIVTTVSHIVQLVAKSVWLAHLVRAPALVCSVCARGAGSIPGQAGRLSLPSLRGR
jgi:hypothetical protein